MSKTNFRFNVEMDKTLLNLHLKNQAIEDFNEAVKKGASHDFLRSLLRQTKYYISECNKEIGMFPQEGYSHLDMTWDDESEK